MTPTLEHSYAALDAVKDEVLAPTKPQSLEEAGISADTIYALLVKWLNAGETSGLELADRIRLPYAIWNR